MEGEVPGLVGHMCPDYGISRVPGKRVRDTDNAETFLREVARFEKDGGLPRLMIMSLGEDHTTGTRPGTYTPRACVASNDLALGRIVEGVTKSRSWPEIAIFVIEDDAQNGPDHVDAHRTIGLVISPYTRRQAPRQQPVHHGQHDPDDGADPGPAPALAVRRGGQADVRGVHRSARPRDVHPRAARIDLNELNAPTAYGAERSARMDFDEYDKIDDFELNEILWRAIKGKDAPLPPAVRRAIAYRPAAPGKAARR